MVVICATKFPAPLAAEVAWATSLRATVPVPMKLARSLGFVTVKEADADAVCGPKSWPEGSSKSMTPSYGLALKLLLEEPLVTSE